MPRLPRLQISSTSTHSIFHHLPPLPCFPRLLHFLIFRAFLLFHIPHASSAKQKFKYPQHHNYQSSSSAFIILFLHCHRRGVSKVFAVRAKYRTISNRPVYGFLARLRAVYDANIITLNGSSDDVLWIYHYQTFLQRLQKIDSVCRHICNAITFSEIHADQ